MDRTGRSAAQTAAELVILILVGLAGNYAKVTLFLNVDLIFGSLIAMVIVLRHGVLWGALAGSVIASYTYVLWNHPYAIVIFGLEALVVGLLNRRYKTGNIILYDAAYWLFLGMPQVFVFYRLVMGLDLPGTAVIMLKQATNGIVNATLAVGVSVAVSLLVRRFRQAGPRKPSVHLQTALSSLMVALSTIPPLILIAILSRGIVRDTEEEVIDHLQRSAESIVAVTSSILPPGGEGLGAPDDFTIDRFVTISNGVGEAHGVESLLIGPNGETRPRDGEPLPGDYEEVRLSELSSNCYLVVPPARPNVTVMDRWARTMAFTEVAVAALPGWRMQLHSHFGQFQRRLHDRLLIHLGIMALFVFAGVFASALFGRGVARRIVGLSEATDGLSTGAGSFEPSAPSVSPIYEIAALEQNFREAGEAIRSQFEQVVEAREEARSADEAKSRFLANMSHEIRNPMNGVLGMLQLLERQDLDPVARDYLRGADTAAKTLLTIIDDVLDLSRIRAGSMEIKPEPFEIRSLIEETVNTFIPRAIATSIPLLWDIDENVPRWLFGDSVRIQQLLFNLIGNAYKFTEEGEVRLDVVADEDGSGSTSVVTFVVSDTGSGIAEAELCRVMEPFVQGETGYQKKAQGTGLGLTIVARLTELMGGAFSIDSTPGEGTRARFSLPLAEVEEPTPREATRRPETAVREPPGNSRVLLVEDNAINRLALSKELENRGYAVGLAQNGLEAIERLRDQEFDLVLMDIQMPVMDGLECTRRIRKGETEAPRDIPIIALTGYAMATDRAIFEAAGVDGQISKPIDYGSLERQLEAILDGAEEHD